MHPTPELQSSQRFTISSEIHPSFMAREAAGSYHDRLQRSDTMRLRLFAAFALVIASLSGLSAHFVKGLASPDLVSAFVSSPTATADPLIPVSWGSQDTSLRVACFNVANTSRPRTDTPDWPRITGVGFELPDLPAGPPSGFSLIAPLDDDWEIVEGVEALLPDHGTVTLDFAIVARVNPVGRRRGYPVGSPHDLPGIPPGQLAGRGNGTRFCVSGPFPDTLPNLGSTTIEKVLNGVVVGLDGVEGNHQGFDAGVWFPTPPGATGPGPDPRAIPLYQ